MERQWEWVGGYSNGVYTDDLIFEVDHATKTLSEITGQTLVSGENKSQFIRFEMPRFYDGIDLSTKTLQIIYQTDSTAFSDINLASCVERCEDRIRFGWVVPAAACYEVGMLSFGIEAVGNDYTWKTRVYDLEVVDGLNGGDIIEEPTEKAWYIELQERCDYVLGQAETSNQSAELSATRAQNAYTDAAAAKSSAILAKESAETAKASAAASEIAAATYANQAASIFALAGNASLAVEDDGSVILTFIEGGTNGN